MCVIVCRYTYIYVFQLFVILQVLYRMVFVHIHLYSMYHNISHMDKQIPLCKERDEIACPFQTSTPKPLKLGMD